MEKIKDTVISWVTSKDFVFQIISWVVGPIFFTNIPIIYFLVYMKENHFFSYDFFVNGLFGLNVFFIVTAFLMILISLGFVGVLIPAVKVILNILIMRKEASSWINGVIKKESFVYFLILFVANILFIGSLGYTGNLTKFWHEYLYLFTLGIIVCIYITGLLFGRGVIKLIALFILIVFTCYSCFYLQELSASLIKIGLNKFNVGGDIKVSIRKESDNAIITDGNLTLLSPNQIYIQTSEGAKILERSGKIIVFSKNEGQ